VEIGSSIYVTTATQWRAWLTKHHDRENEVWLVFPKKGSGKTRIPYNDAVEQALCFGWVDSQTKAIDDQAFAQRFSRRRGTANWSQANIERLRDLIASDQMTTAGMAVIKDEGILSTTEPTVAPDVLRALKGDPEVWENFQRFPDSYKRIRLAFIESRRSRGPNEFERSLQFFIKKTKRNVQYQFGTKRQQ
jgi:uncharacterized protein YdeI (YjbR/CyaY-like superfamily)